jgi:epoxyqueuosine reductase
VRKKNKAGVAYSLEEKTAFIKSLAKEKYGFSEVGIARAQRLDSEEKNLREWLDRGYAGTMFYIEKRFEKRLNPELVVPNAQSIVVLTYNYAPAESPKTSLDTPKIARYAYGRDYHLVVRKKVRDLLKEINGPKGEIRGRAFVDSAPIMEREWAKRAGVGWFGKNTLIIHPKRGSYFFLAVMVLSTELIYDEPISDYCGTCTRCIEACPTQAIDAEGYLVNASQCISYLTIETHKEVPEALGDKFEGWAFGCDICQEVCPWNKFALPHEEKEFAPPGDWLQWTRERWEDLSQEEFETFFKESPLARPGFEKMQENVKRSTQPHSS